MYFYFRSRLNFLIPVILYATMVLAMGCSSSDGDATTPDPQDDVGVDAQLDTAPDSEDADIAPDLGCASHDLGNSVPVTHMGHTEELVNFVISPRLEWKDAPDDALIFTAPTSDDYAIDISSTTAGFEVTASAQEFLGGSDIRFFTPQDCPEDGEVIEIDAYYSMSYEDSDDQPLPLEEGQTILIFVSAPYWSEVKSGPYSITVRKAKPPTD